MGEGGTRTYATAMKRSSALHNFMIVAPLSYQAIWLLWSENWPLRSDICLQRIVSVVGSTAIFFAVQKMFCYHLRQKARLCSVQKFFDISFIYQMIAVNYIWKHNVFAYPKREHYCFNRFCFEMARQITLSAELSWQPKLARYFKTEPTVIVPFSFGISENTVGLFI
jgi:hypothetical protein